MRQNALRVRPKQRGKAWLFAGSERGRQGAAFMYTLIALAKRNDINPHAWRADVIARLSDLPASRLPELFPWNGKATKQEAVKTAAVLGGCLLFKTVDKCRIARLAGMPDMWNSLFRRGE